MAVGVGSHPREHIGLANRSIPINTHGRCPGVAPIRGRREKDILVVRPDGIDVAEVVDSERGADVGGAMSGSGRARGAGKDLVIRKGDGWRAQAGIHRNSNIHASQWSGIQVFGSVVGSYKRDVEISLARAGAGVVVDFDLGGDVSAVRGHKAARGGKGRGVDGFPGTIDVGEAAVIGTLHLNVEVATS